MEWTFNDAVSKGFLNLQQSDTKFCLFPFLAQLIVFYAKHYFWDSF